MKPGKKKTKRRSASPSLPMRGGLLGAVLSLLRLNGKLDSGGLAVSMVTAKRVCSDSPDVATATREGFIRGAAQIVFPRAYLEGRGLAEADIERHQDEVTAALAAILGRWDRLATAQNTMDLPATTLDFMLVADGIVREIAVRAAAYLILYDRVHGAFASIPVWVQDEGLAGWYRDVGRRAGNLLKVDALAASADVDRNTVRKIRAGRHIPQSETIARLARALERHGVMDRDRKRRLCAPELEFEMRLACAAAALRPERRGQSMPALELGIGELTLLREQFRGVDIDGLRDLLLRGTASPHFAAFQECVRDAHARRIHGLVLSMRARAARARALLDTDLAAAMRLVSAENEQMANVLLTLTNDLGTHQLDGLRRLHEHVAELGRAIAEGRSPPGIDDVDRIKASLIVLGALGARSDAEKEAALQAALDVCASSAEAREQMALLLLRKGRVDAGIAHLREAIAGNPDRVDLRETLAMFLEAQERYAEALEVLPSADGLSATGRVLRANALWHTDEWSAAESEYSAVVEERPRWPPALTGLAMCRRREGDEAAARKYEQAAAFYATAVR